jgi:flagellar biosynthesis/type III secretory pathway M-ring protein FliF/YscJ
MSRDPGRGRSVWVWPLIGALAFVTGLQKRFILDPVTAWLRDLPDAAAIAVAAAVVAFVFWRIVRRERRRRAAVAAAATRISAALTAPGAPSVSGTA